MKQYRSTASVVYPKNNVTNLVDSRIYFIADYTVCYMTKHEITVFKVNINTNV